MFKQLSRFPLDDVCQSAWSQILVTCLLRHEPAWAAFRAHLKTDKQLDVEGVVCTGFGPVEDRIGIYLFTADRRVIYAELSELTQQDCQLDSWDDQQLIDADSVADMVAVYLQSSPDSRGWFNDMVAECHRKEEELRVSLGDGYAEAALLQTDDYLDFHRGWLLPLVELHFSPTPETN